ncbi:MAG: hypothetical protein DCC75_06315 [Proteobacteria bacterium]|nr:MAG: hypothetical protein DCC75_06315 [Pseudomonadota bacterium]
MQARFLRMLFSIESSATYFTSVSKWAFSSRMRSRNEYCWTPRIKREDGCLRLVMGLGTRAVDRGEGSDFCRFVPLGAPTLRPQADSRDIAKYCQRGVDVIDLESGKFTCVTLDKILEQGEPIPHLSKLVQVLQSGHLRDGFGEFLTLSPGEQPKITLEGIVKSDEFIGTMRWVLSSLESAFQCPVDVEFAFDGRKLHILQCRPQAIGGEEGPVTLPGEVSKDSTVLEVHSGLMRSVRIEGIKYAVYVSPSAYDELPSKEERVRVARLVGEINNRLPKRSFALIGPGRWGSNDVKLGVPVTYADILNTCLLVEVGHEKSGRLPELSYGTHFFQDLVESRIAYVPVFPGKSGSLLNEQLLEGRPNEAARILGGLSQYEGLEKVVRVIDLEAALGKAATLYIDSEHANKGILCSV